MRLVLVGMPLRHSRSPRIHRAALAACAIAGDYSIREVDAAGFAMACGEIASGALDGANVTMPYKRAARRACDCVDADADRAGAVNTLALSERGLMGWNTDVVAVRLALSRLEGSPVVILGAGGAAAAALAAASGRPTAVMARHRGAPGAMVGRPAGRGQMREMGGPGAGARLVNPPPPGVGGGV